ncbi:MAG: alkylation response protein AidB-like acyl-CoA dehydrogenase, partial [Paracoccaceae bacterium]
MNFALSDEQQAIFDMTRDFGAERIAPNSAAWEDAGSIPRELLAEAGALGLGGIYVAEDSGGSGLSRLDAALIFEALGMADPSVAAFISIHNMCARMVDAYGSPELKSKWLPGLCALTTVASYCLTEPGAGSDAAALRTKATRTNDGWSLSGAKAFISGGGFSDLYLVMSRTGQDGPKGVSCLLIEDGTPGLSFGAQERKMGWKAQPTAQVQLDDCVVPAGNLLGDEGAGFKYAMAGLDGGRLNIAATALGGAQTCL